MLPATVRMERTAPAAGSRWPKSSKSYMSQVPIPAWNAMQVLPPVNGLDPVSPDRSPYEVSLLSVVIRFVTSWQRCKILRGFLGFRATLHKAGITSGFQWVDGSFSENVEVLEARNPRDVDVVSFLDDPNGDLGRKFPGALADHGEVKKTFLVDGYWVETTLPGLSRPSRARHAWYRCRVWRCRHKGVRGCSDRCRGFVFGTACANGAHS